VPVPSSWRSCAAETGTAVPGIEIAKLLGIQVLEPSNPAFFISRWKSASNEAQD
jgi:hypothetical protein